MGDLQAPGLVLFSSLEVPQVTLPLATECSGLSGGPCSGRRDASPPARSSELPESRCADGTKRSQAIVEPGASLSSLRGSCACSHRCRLRHDAIAARKIACAVIAGLSAAQSGLRCGQEAAPASLCLRPALPSDSAASLPPSLGRAAGSSSRLCHPARGVCLSEETPDLVGRFADTPPAQWFGSLDDIPSDACQLTPGPRGGYQFLGEMYVYDRRG